MAEKKITVTEQHRVYVDPTYGLRVPDAAALADTGVVTNSQDTYRAGDAIPVSGEDAAGLEQVGVARLKGAGD
jgi:hypothetical protein